jgi:hypothetical protein
MKIILILIVVFILWKVAEICITFSKSRRSSKSLKEWMEFNERIRSEFLPQVVDVGIKHEILHEMVKISLGDKPYLKIAEIKSEFIKKYSSHIPSLIREEREKKLEQLRIK